MSDYQKLFDLAFDKVIAQGCPSLSVIGSCVYRGEDGKRCAIGHLITDEQMSKYGIDEGVMPEDFYPELIAELAPVDHTEGDVEAFLMDLQHAHDTADRGVDFGGDYRANMRCVAKKWKLKDK